MRPHKILYKVTFYIGYFFLIAKQDSVNLAVDLGVSLKTNSNCCFNSKVWTLGHLFISECVSDQCRVGFYCVCDNLGMC